MFGIKRIVRQARRRIILAHLLLGRTYSTTVHMRRYFITNRRATMLANALQAKFGEDNVRLHYDWWLKASDKRTGASWSIGYAVYDVDYKFPFGRVGFLNELS